MNPPIGRLPVRQCSLGRVRRGWPRDFLNRFCRVGGFRALHGYVGLRNNPDQLPTPFHDRDSPYLVLLHGVQSILQFILRMASKWFLGHHILHVGAVCVAALGHYV